MNPYRQLLVLKEFYSTESLHEFLDDAMYFCEKESEYLKIDKKEPAYQKLCMFRHSEQVDRLYQDTILCHYAVEQEFPMQYKRRTHSELEKAVESLYK